MRAKKPDGEDGEHAAQPADSCELNGEGEEEPPPTEEVDSPSLEVSPLQDFTCKLEDFLPVSLYLFSSRF